MPTVIINSGSTGHRVGAVHFKVLRWLSSLNQNVDHTGSLTVVSACKDKNQRVSVQDSMESRAAQKNDMLIMSEVRKSSLAFNAWGTRFNSLFASFSLSLTCCHFICLSFFLSFPLQLFSTPPIPSTPPSPMPCGIEALRQQCKSRRDELLVYTFNLGWQGGQKK